MKKKVCYVIGLIFLLVVYLVFLHKEGSQDISKMVTTENLSHADLNMEKPNERVNIGKTRFEVPSKKERLRMNNSERIALFERLGCLPDDPEYPSDYWLAENTSWWGKRLDAEKFWKERVIWYDDRAVFDARRHGRGYPPMPYDDPQVANRSDEDRKNEDFGSLDSPTPRYVSSEREKAFWDKFRKTHPHPPANIKSWLKDYAKNWLSDKYVMANNPEEAKRFRINEQSLDRSLARALRDANTFWYPHECVSPEAYYWEHVMNKRKEYEEEFANNTKSPPGIVQRFFDTLYVDPKHVTEPLTEEDIDAANAWKVAYLNRLRAEKWDESYINAYLDAWDLTEEYVFGEKGEQ